MQNAVIFNADELRQHDETIAKEVARQVAKAIAETGGVSEPLPNVVSANWILDHYSIYHMKYSKLNELHNEILAEYGVNNEICRKRGGTVYYDRHNFEAWLLGRKIKKKQDPRLVACQKY